MSSKRKKSQRRPNIPLAAAGPAPEASAARRPTFAPDYEYVKKDLRRIGLLAGSFIAVMVILSFFIR